MKRLTRIERNTSETRISATIDLDGSGNRDISTGIPFFDHMLDLFARHGFFDLTIHAEGDIGVDNHHTVEDIGIVLGSLVNDALGDRKGIVRYGHAVTPMDETLSEVSLDLSNRPYLVCHMPEHMGVCGTFDTRDVKEFLRAFASKGGMNLHVNVRYGENDHHIVESVFKGLGRALDQAVSLDKRITGHLSTKGMI
ncbi:MAG: imidazoleglycerol-phosphate dehydratase HisB [Proteobacteria bacterium]|nr:imidazoleglycerol-phosphate dehydratase HisB [Pseudomonadota bacterium]